MIILSYHHRVKYKIHFITILGGVFDSEDVYQLRNQWMIDHSSKVIAVYDGQPGGTRNTIMYAKAHGIPSGS